MFGRINTRKRRDVTVTLGGKSDLMSLFTTSVAELEAYLFELRANGATNATRVTLNDSGCWLTATMPLPEGNSQ